MGFTSVDGGWWTDGLETTNILPSSLHVVIAALLKAGAIPSTTLPEAYRSTGTDEEVALLNALQTRGLVETEGGTMQSLSSTALLQGPHPLFARRVWGGGVRDERLGAHAGA